MEQENKLVYKNPIWEPEQKKATFFYRLEHNGEVFNFSETLSFSSEQPIVNIPQALLKNTLDNLSLALGISYYKLYCPKQLILEDMQLSEEQADFWNSIYIKGLGEFFYKNKIDYRGLISFPFGLTSPNLHLSMGESGTRKDRSLVGIGGGKDSIVAAEALKALKKSFSSFVVNGHAINKQTIELLGTDAIFVWREIDPALFELNKRKDIFNGHVPVSSHYAFIGLLAALLYDYRYVVVANEQSANYGNTTYLGETINHQWSKSFEFEQLFQNYIRQYITPDVVYFSLLRPLSEIAIARRFTDYPQYFPVFSSCNRNFKIKEKADRKWCGECSKCAFTFALLSAFVPKQQLKEIFGQNLFDKESLLPAYEELLGAARIKPFDCVGTPEETKAAFYMAMQRKEYENDIIMKFFQKEVMPKITNIDTIKKEVFSLSDRYSVPKEFQEVVR